MSVSNVRYLGKKMAPAHTDHARSVPKARRSKGGNGHPSIFNVKLPKLKKKGSGVEKTPSRGSPEPAAKRAKTSQTQGSYIQFIFSGLLKSVFGWLAHL